MIDDPQKLRLTPEVQESQRQEFFRIWKQFKRYASGEKNWYQTGDKYYYIHFFGYEDVLIRVARYISYAESDLAVDVNTIRTEYRALYDSAFERLKRDLIASIEKYFSARENNDQAIDEDFKYDFNHLDDKSIKGVENSAEWCREALKRMVDRLGKMQVDTRPFEKRLPTIYLRIEKVKAKWMEKAKQQVSLEATTKGLRDLTKSGAEIVLSTASDTAAGRKSLKLPESAAIPPSSVLPSDPITNSKIPAELPLTNEIKRLADQLVRLKYGNFFDRWKYRSLLKKCRKWACGTQDKERSRIFSGFTDTDFQKVIEEAGEKFGKN